MIKPTIHSCAVTVQAKCGAPKREGAIFWDFYSFRQGIDLKEKS